MPISHAQLDRLGGLLKRMPWTGSAILVGSVAIAGLPPLNGFASEFVLYRACFGSEGLLGAPTACDSLVGRDRLVGPDWRPGRICVCASFWHRVFGRASHVARRHGSRTGRPHDAADPGVGRRLYRDRIALAAGCSKSCCRSSQKLPITRANWT